MISPDRQAHLHSLTLHTDAQKRLKDGGKALLEDASVSVAEVAVPGLVEQDVRVAVGGASLFAQSLL